MKDMQEKSNEKLNRTITKGFKKAFERLCISTLIDGYNLMIEAGEYERSWEEESLTANLIKHMNLSPETIARKLDIIPEYHIYTTEVYDGVEKPKKALRIDIRFMSWSYPDKVEYFIEAKNLAQNDWMKPDGSRVKASGLIGRYINTGIDKFVKECYPLGGGCMAGYVLEGNLDIIVDKLNKRLKSSRGRPQEILIKVEPINGHPDCYRSGHISKKSDSLLSLNHIFLNFKTLSL
ncbi:MAG: hypothetical protein GY950_23495 [bacterium]|nr:hypothetical protein [bacterium]